MVNYTFHPKLLVRIPLRPLKTSFTVEELNQLFLDPEIYEALYLSSPDLLNEYEKWLNKGAHIHADSKKLVLSLLKYMLRLHSRCTPFGLFAGCSVVEWSQPMSVDPKKFSRSTRLDMNYTCALSIALAKLACIKPYLKYYPNTSIYPVYNKLRYVEYFYKNKRRIYQISAVDDSEYLAMILQAAETGATFDELIKLLTDDDIEHEDAKSFVQEIIDSQLLISELEPAVTGTELLGQIIKTLDEVYRQFPSPELLNVVSLLNSVKNTLGAKDHDKTSDLEYYYQVIMAVNQLGVPFEAGKLFQTDLFQNIAGSGKEHKINSLPASTQDSLQKALVILNKLAPLSSRQNIDTFKERFIKKYEYREIALQEALDNEHGVGYGAGTVERGDFNPLIDDLAFSAINGTDSMKVSWDRIDSFLFQKLLDAHKNDLYSISITEEELKDFPSNWTDLPASMSVIFSHIGKKDDTDMLFVRNIGNPSAVNLLGRFAAGSTDVLEVVSDITAFEETYFDNEIVAEISHLPENRLGNVLLRPAFRNFEIPYLTKSALPASQQVNVNDLYISIRNNKIRLRSKKFNRQVMPRLGTAHNFSNRSLPLYQFLCDMQLQSIRAGLFFDWRGIKHEFKFQPRVTVDNLVIFPATWQLAKGDFREFLAYNLNNQDATDLMKITGDFRRKFKMPDCVLLVEGDNELLIDFRNNLSVEMFISAIRKSEVLILKEFLFDPANAIVKDEHGGSYTNEFIATVFKNAPVEQSISTSVSHLESIKNIRKFSLGTEWLYFKLYCGTKVSDSILKEKIAFFTDQLVDERLIDKWFFIRYYDPDFHLRVRVHLTSPDLLGTVIKLVTSSIAEVEKSGVIWKIQTDSYERELERYGQCDISLTEDIFYYDSICATKMLEFCPDDETRWLFALKSVDSFLDSFDLQQDTRLDYIEKYKNAYANEFKVDHAFKLQLDKKFRDKRLKISKAILEDTNPSVLNDHLLECLYSRNQKIKQVAEVIRTQTKLSDSMLRDFISSHIHMVLNRIFRSKPRENELVVYDFLLRTYQSEKARNKVKINVE